MNKENIKCGDIIHSNDDTIIKVHHIDDFGNVCYLAYADGARGRIGLEPYNSYYGNINDCYPATDNEKEWLNDWIKEQK